MSPPRSPVGKPQTLALLAGMVAPMSGCAQPTDVAIDESTPIECPTGPRILSPPEGQLYHGVYPGGITGEEDDLTLADVASYEAAVDRRVAWVYFSHNWYGSRAFPVGTAAWIRKGGAIPFIRLMLRSSPDQHVAEPLFTLEAIIDGAFDADLAAWGQEAATFGTPLIVESGTEVNGSWFPWNGVWNGGAGTGPERFRRAYRHIVRTICDQGAGNITWAFHVDVGDEPDEAWNRFENYYPGDDAVDWLGVSVYGALTPTDRAWPSFRERLDGAFDRISALGSGMPIFVFEFGATTGNPLGDAAAWADDALGDLIAGRWPGVRGFSWWNERWPNDTDPDHDTNMRVQDIPEMAPVFRGHLAAGAVLGRPLVSEHAPVDAPTTGR